MYLRWGVHTGLPQARGPGGGDSAVQAQGSSRLGEKPYPAEGTAGRTDRVNRTAAKPLAAYTEFHPRWYRPRVSVYWWLGEWQYLRFILRELSSVFVAAFVIVTLLGLRALRNGPD